MANDELTQTEKRAQRAAAKKAADEEKLAQWKKDKADEASWNARTGGIIRINPGAMIVDDVTTLKNGTESVLVTSTVTGVTESVLFRAGKAVKGQEQATMRNYMNHVGVDDTGTDIYEPSSRTVQKLIEVRPYTYGDASKKAGQTVMTPTFSDEQKASVKNMPPSVAGTGPNHEGAKNGAIVSGLLRMISEDENGARLTVGMRDQNGNVPTYGGSVFFDVPKSVEKDNFKVRAMLNELRGMNSKDGEKPRGVYADVVCLMDAHALARPKPVQRNGEDQGEYDQRVQRWEQSMANREKYGIQSRESFAITDVLDMTAMTKDQQMRISSNQNAREKAEMKAEASHKQEGPKA